MEFRTILIGGIIPSVFLGLGTVLMKLSLKGGISLPFYLVLVGAAVLLYGGTSLFLTNERNLTLQGGLFAFGMGLTWSTAIFCMSYSISKLNMPVSVIAPLTNSNALIAVVLSMIIFSEWRDLNISKVFVGTLFIISGATLVSMASVK